jgi:hypothetical protein
MEAYIGREELSVNDNSLDIIQILVMFQCLYVSLLLIPEEIAYPLNEPRLFSEVGNPRPIIMRKHLITQNRISDLRSIDQVHLQQSSLKSSLFRLVLLERIEEEGSSLLNHVLRHEDIDDSLQIDQRTGFIIYELTCEFRCFIGVGSSEVLEEGSVIGRVVYLLRVQ